jgi:transcriptional/translational regulatory protein YebC/TACO1
VVTVSKEAISEDRLFEIALEAGAEDVSSESDDAYEIYAAVGDLEGISRALEAASIPILSAETSRIPQTTVLLEQDDAVKLMRLLEALEEQDDVQKVYSNFDVSKETMEGLREE